MPIPNVAYKALISPGPLILVRVPLRWRPSARRMDYVQRWRDIVRAAHAIVQAHGVRAKDLSAIDHVVGHEDWSPHPKEMWPPSPRMIAKNTETARKADEAFDGSTEWFRAFYLYDWLDGEFVLVREPVEATSEEA